MKTQDNTCNSRESAGSHNSNSSATNTTIIISSLNEGDEAKQLINYSSSSIDNTSTASADSTPPPPPSYDYCSATATTTIPKIIIPTPANNLQPDNNDNKDNRWVLNYKMYLCIYHYKISKSCLIPRTKELFLCLEFYIEKKTDGQKDGRTLI